MPELAGAGLLGVGAQDDGAQLFLVPAANCAEALDGHYDPEKMRQNIVAAHLGGWRVAAHAIGDPGAKGEHHGPGRLVIDVTDADGNLVAETCFDLSGPSDLQDVCDRQNDGRLNIPDLPPGEYAVTQTQTAAGFSPAPGPWRSPQAPSASRGPPGSN